MMASAASQPVGIDWRNLIRVGFELVNLQRRGDPPTDEHVRRAISNAYYALFHALATSNADVLIGRPHDTMTAVAWTRVYRAIEHGAAKNQLRQHRQELSTAAQAFADTFIGLQDLRHSADYDPNVTFTGLEAAVWLGLVEQVCVNYLQVDRGERLYIATLTLLRRR